MVIPVLPRGTFTYRHPALLSQPVLAENQRAAISAGPAFIFSTHLAGIHGNILTAVVDGALAKEDEPPAAGVQMNAHGKEG